MSAATYIPLARAMDTFGRAEGFLAMAIFATLGLIMMAACHNLPTFCAAYVSSATPLGKFLPTNILLSGRSSTASGLAA